MSPLPTDADAFLADQEKRRRITATTFTDLPYEDWPQHFADLGWCIENIAQRWRSDIREVRRRYPARTNTERENER